MAKVFVSTCGTSLLTNQTDTDLRSLLMKTANCQENDLKPEEKKRINNHLQEIQKRLQSMSVIEVKKISAELNGILTYYQDQIPTKKGTPDYHYLLVSDTYQGVKVGEILSNWLKQDSLLVEVVKIAELATNNRDKFRLAMSELINWCHNTLTNYRNRGYQVIFNLTGGFKSVQGFLQTMGMFYADECVYIFQFSSQLLEIPRLPIKLELEEIVGQNLTVFRRLDSYLSVTKSEAHDIPETLLFFLEEDNQVSLSEWGELIWRQAKSSYYQQELLPPLSDKLVYSDEFKKNIQDLHNRPDRIELINLRCDQLSHFLDTQNEYNPGSLDFKSIISSPFPDSTHECDAWADQDAQRLFGHWLDNGKYIIDRLGKKLA